jgi:co-chaperonin GroES (HSP10)
LAGTVCSGFAVGFVRKIIITACLGLVLCLSNAIAAAASPSGTIVTGSTTNITDTQGNVWTLSNGAAMENGTKQANCSLAAGNIILLLYFDNTIYEENSANVWWWWNGSVWGQSSCGDLRISSGSSSTPSSSGSSSTSSGPGASSGSGSSVINGACGSANNGAFSSAPTTNLYSAGTATPLQVLGNSWIWQCAGSGNFNNVAGCSANMSGSGSSSGGGSFTVSGGFLHDPTGAKFVPEGTGVFDYNASDQMGGNSIIQISSGYPLTTLFPRINYIRVMVFPTYHSSTSFTFNPVSYYTQIAALCRTNHIVCEFEDHSSNGSYWQSGIPGGVAHTFSIPPTGAALASNLSFWSAMATQCGMITEARITEDIKSAGLDWIKRSGSRSAISRPLLARRCRFARSAGASNVVATVQPVARRPVVLDTTGPLARPLGSAPR